MIIFQFILTLLTMNKKTVNLSESLILIGRVSILEYFKINGIVNNLKFN